MRTALALCMLIVLSGCSLLPFVQRKPANIQFATRLTTYLAAKPFRLNNGSAFTIVSHLNTLSDVLPSEGPPDFNKARDQISKRTSGYTSILLISVIDLAERYATNYLTSFRAGPDGAQKPVDWNQLRTILEAVLTGAKEGVYLTSAA